MPAYTSRQSGETFNFEVYTIGSDWYDRSGIYMMCGLGTDNLWNPYYIGQASSFRDRLCSHEAWEPAVLRGATNVLAMVVPSQSERDRIEEILIGELDPPVNVQLRPFALSSALAMGRKLPPPQALGLISALARGRIPSATSPGMIGFGARPLGQFETARDPTLADAQPGLLGLGATRR